MPKPEREQIRILQQQLSERDQYISDLLQSKSWKITHPIRWLYSQLLRLFPQQQYGPARNIKTKANQSLGGLVPNPALPEQAITKEPEEKIARTILRFFLYSQEKLIFPSSAKPKISILIVLYNRAELTFRCLLSLIENVPSPAEVIIVNNGSSDETGELLERIEGVRVIHNDVNKHFISGANQAASESHGEYLLFLNNDTELLPGCIQSAQKTIESATSIGAVGAKLILPNGSLQEAGSIIWNDGSCAAYGRGDDPFAPQYMFRRDVDFCSAAFLLTKRELFISTGGFDESYKPAYYEDADYCLKLWKSGMRTIYDPYAALIHHEFGSSFSMEEAIELQKKNRQIFISRQADELAKQPDPRLISLVEARTHLRPLKKILFIDDRVPHPTRGSGFPRAHAILLALHRMSCFVTIYPMSFINEDWNSVYADVPKEVEVILEKGHSFLFEFMESRKDFYDSVLVSRPHNMAIVQQLYKARADLFENARLIYDSEALHSIRDLIFRRSRGEEVSEKEMLGKIRKEIQLASDANVVLTSSIGEKELCVEHGIKKVLVLGHCVPITPTESAFSERTGFLFVGPIYNNLSPNADALRWFINDVLPLINDKLGPDVDFTIVGACHSDSIQALAGPRIRILGHIDDLTEIYDRARVFVAPARHATGIPIKILNAAANGLPVVATSLLGAQLDWKNGVELLLADTKEAFSEKCVELYKSKDLWHKIRQNALNRVTSDCSQESFGQTLRIVFFS